MSNRALCPECGKPMRFDRRMDVWDCGPPDEGGHGYWDPSPALERESDRQLPTVMEPYSQAALTRSMEWQTADRRRKEE